MYIHSSKCPTDYILTVLFMCHKYRMSKIAGCDIPMNAHGLLSYVVWFASIWPELPGLQTHAQAWCSNWAIAQPLWCPSSAKGFLFSLLSLLQTWEMGHPHITIFNYFCGPTLTSLQLLLFLFLYIPALFSHFLATSSFFFCPH